MSAKALNKNKLAALYIRVSTDAQYEEGYSVDAQKEMLEAYCKMKGIKEFEVYIDGGFSGSNIERPEMHRLIEDAKSDKLSCAIVYKLDRMSRSQKDTLYLIEDVFSPHGVDFISLNENLDTSTPYGRAMIGILSAFAQLERETIRERTRMGMRERVKSGLWMGGGRVPFGYDYDKSAGIIVPNKDAETVRKMYDLYLQGYSTDKIAQFLGLKYSTVVIQILKRKSNAGYISYNGEEYLGRHEPIISIETYHKTMDMMKDRSVNNLHTSNNLLTGLIVCGKCGAKMRYQKWGKNDSKIWCYSQDKSKRHLIKDPDCNNSKVWASEVEAAVVRELKSISVKEKTRGEYSQIESQSSALETLTYQYDVCSNKIKRLYNLYAEDNNDILLESINALKSELKSISKNIEIEREKGEYTQKAQKIRDTVSHLSDIWDVLTRQEQRNIIRQCVEKITINDGNVKIHFKLDELT